MMQVLIYLCCSIIANGDISFGVIQPNVQFSSSFITPSVIGDDIIEGEEIGQIKILDFGFADGFAPRFQSVRIILTDDDGKVTIVIMQNFILSLVYILIVSSYSCISSSSICSRKHCIISSQYNTAPSSQWFITII